MNPATEQALSLGELFRQTRESLNLSLDDVAKAITLRPSILQQLENNEFIQKTTPATFVKGYVRSYARFLHLPDSVWENISFGEMEKNDLGKNIRSTRAVNQYSSHSRWVGRLTTLVLLVVISMTGLWWWQNYQQNNQERDNLVQNYVASTPENAVDTAVKTTDTVQITPIANAETTNAESAMPEKAESDSSTAISNALPVVTQPLAEAAATPAENIAPQAENTAMPTNSSQENELSATAPEEKAIPDTQNALETPEISSALPAFKEDLVIEVLANSSWISVKDKNRRVLAQKEYKQGETLTFNGDEFSLIVGAPSNVRITYKGANYPLKVDGRVAKFKLSQP